MGAKLYMGGSYLNIESPGDKREWKNNAGQICWNVQRTREVSCLAIGGKFLNKQTRKLFKFILQWHPKILVILPYSNALSI